MIPAPPDSVNAIAKLSEGFGGKAVLQLLPGALASLVAWVTSRAVSSRRASELDMLLRRIQLVEHAQKIQGENDTALRAELDSELHDIVAALAELRKANVARHPSAGVSATRSRWQEWLIAYKQASVKGTLYKFAFYASCLFAVFGFLVPTTVNESDVGTLEAFSVALLSGGFYLVIGLAFRSAAVRDYRKRVQTAAVTR